MGSWGRWGGRVNSCVGVGKLGLVLKGRGWEEGREGEVPRRGRRGGRRRSARMCGRSLWTGGGGLAGWKERVGASGKVPCWRRERDFAQLLQVSMDLVHRSIGTISAVGIAGVRCVSRQGVDS